MLLRHLLPAGILCFCSSSAVAVPVVHDSSVAPVADSHEIHLPGSDCLLAERDYSDESFSNSYLTLHFSTRDGSLFANNDQIFPPSILMQLHADRKWVLGDNKIENVPLTYALNIRPTAVETDTPMDDVFVLRIDLFDMQGQRATPNIIRIDLRRDSEEGLVVSKIIIHPIRSHHGQRCRNQKERPWDVKYWRLRPDSYPGVGKDNYEDKPRFRNCPGSESRSDQELNHPPTYLDEDKSSLHNPAHNSADARYIPLEAVAKGSQAAQCHHHSIHQHGGLPDSIHIPGLLPSLFGVMCLVAVGVAGMVARRAIQCLRDVEEQRRNEKNEKENGDSKLKSSLDSSPDVEEGRVGEVCLERSQGYVDLSIESGNR